MALELQNNLSHFNNPWCICCYNRWPHPPHRRLRTAAAALPFPHLKTPSPLPHPINLQFLNPGSALSVRKMSQRNGPKLELKLNLSPPRMNRRRAESPSRSLTVSPSSPPSSCVSSELNQQDEYLRYSTSPEATSMMLVGCPRCLMYVMLSEEDPRCPKCKSTVLLDFIHDQNLAAAPTAVRKTKKS